MKKQFWLIALFLSPLWLLAQQRIIVDATGKGNYTTIQEAVNSLPDSSATDRIIFIKNGVYKEQVNIAKAHIVLQGESKEKTIITGAIASLIYSCEHPGDNNSAILNLDGNDITLLNLTVENSYGKTAPDSVLIDCPNKPEKVKVIKTAHQFALKTNKATRLKVINCLLRAWGNDTVSPWTGATGMYYFKDCTMVGGTDFYCPRGWAYADNCTFIQNVPAAAVIWHDGSKDRNQKSVFRNCSFKGDVPYNLGRYHHEANFYLINCRFDNNLIDTPIYKAATAKPMAWESTAYYYGCHKEGKQFDWFKDNLNTAPGAPAASAINAVWTFEGKWDPAARF